MPGPRQGNRRKDRDTFNSKPLQKTRQPAKQPEKQSEKQSERQTTRKPSTDKDNKDSLDSGPIDLSTTIPLPLQQLLLDVFKTALLSAPANPPNGETEPQDEAAPLDIKSLIQTIKSHLYQRDFDSAFTEAGEDLLRAYALRWSAARALGYAGIFKAVLRWMRLEEEGAEKGDSPSGSSVRSSTRAVCLGGGAGAEIVALAAAWRDLEIDAGVAALAEGVAGASLDENERTGGEENGAASLAETGTAVSQSQSQSQSPGLVVSAVDIADWSVVVERLSKTVTSPNVPTPPTSTFQPPLMSGCDGSQDDRSGISVSFSRSDLLVLPESDLKDVLLGSEHTASASTSLLVTLMFTLNELFSTSMAKTTGLLLRMTEILPSGAVLLVVDSPGSYSTLKLGKGKDGAVQERQYPMKFLLDHALLSVTEGKWERVLTQDSRWWRRDAARLRYEVGEGAGLEDMRYQLHVYRRL
ncbi:uncharacterized protein N7482_005851 [Penicillium canariense]|uniref:25S rRNA (Uridine(2843)-N(3))-methyltransferase n=1 Tax=Penicillium canariense TaxID=189055 RepID=A0A9W9I360_9EURO|nr:uncharacterized protein N7482_005851 [Penicillium canariense]KAJ5167070.1 hypothetical protein N7482_005851 [Penicillium canariense]